MKHRTILITISIYAAWCCAVALCFALLHNPTVYHAVRGVAKTYRVEKQADNTIEVTRERIPFNPVHDTLLLHWDAENYKLIADHLYDPQYVWPGYKAFFPLFPLLWRLTGLSPIGVCVLNFLLFVAGLLLLLKTCKGLSSLGAGPAPSGGTDSLRRLLVLLCMPFMVIFLIPYSEGLFFLCISLGLYGLFKQRYWIFFIGFMLGCMTRAAGSILLVAWVITDVLYALRYRTSWRGLLRSLALHLAPVAAGVAVVVAIQVLSGGGSPFDFARAQSEWGKEWSLPSWPLTDWSDEGKCVTQPLIFILFLPALGWLCAELVKSLRGGCAAAKQQDTPAATDAPAVRVQWLVRVLSVLFFVGNVMLALFTQKGCMFSQARLLTCTPFFFFLAIDFEGALRRPGREARVWRWVVVGFMVLAAALCRLMLFKGQTLGCIITFLFLTLVLFAPLKPKAVDRVVLAVALLLNIFWTANLFNCFLSGGWIFT